MFKNSFEIALIGGFRQPPARSTKKLPNSLAGNCLIHKHCALFRGYGRPKFAKTTLTNAVIQCGLVIGPMIALPVLLGCRTPAPLPQVNLTEPGWNVQQGQVIWLPQRDGHEIAGELLVATSTNSMALVQFIKTPFPMVVAQQTRSSWQIEFPTGKIRYAGHGKPPSRLIWFWLIHALSGKSLPKPWLWHQDKNGWRLENRVTGESLEGYFQVPATLNPSPQNVRRAARLAQSDRAPLQSSNTLKTCARNGPSDFGKADPCRTTPCLEPVEHFCTRAGRTPVASLAPA